jgi:hypothetical protein
MEKMMSDIINNLKKLEKEYQKAIFEIRDKISDLEDIPKAKALVGKYFKSSNSYGHGTSWTMYVRIIDSKDADVLTDCFQEDSKGHIEFIYGRDEMYQIYENSRYIPIDKKEYFDAYDKLVTKIISKNKRGK